MASIDDAYAPYNDPGLQQSQQAAQTAGNTAVAYQSAASLLPQKLREAVMNKVNYNQDIIQDLNKKQSEYFGSPAASREKYLTPGSESFVWNPFQAENLVTQARQTAYQPYANLSDILSQRMGTLENIISAGTGAFNADVAAKQGAYDIARQNYTDKLGMAKVLSDIGLDKYKEEQQNYRSGLTAGGSGIGNGNINGTQVSTTDVQNLARTALAQGKPVLISPDGEYFTYDSLNDPAYIADKASGFIPFGTPQQIPIPGNGTGNTPPTLSGMQNTINKMGGIRDLNFGSTGSAGSATLRR